MQPYANLDGHSGVAEFEFAPSAIFIRFVGKPTIYEYDHVHPGAQHVREMKARAKEGHGLATLISQKVGNNYAGKYESISSLRAALRKRSLG